LAVGRALVLNAARIQEKRIGTVDPVPEQADCLAVGPALVLNAARIQEKRIGTGDKVYVTGLFSPAMGIQKNSPIVRSGHLALSPPEEMPIKNWDMPMMRAFLIEM